MKLYNHLIAECEHSEKIKVFDPSPSILPRKACYNIILKSKKREQLEPLLKLVPADWKVEIEPKELG